MACTCEHSKEEHYEDPNGFRGSLCSSAECHCMEYEEADDEQANP